MRTLDPQLDELTTLLESDRRPTWLVEWVSFDDWDHFGNARFRSVLEQHYELHGDGCEGVVWLRKDVDRPAPSPECDRPWV
jgi:hypothetical protein